MSAATVIFPHQLYPNHPALDKGNVVYMVETDLYFTQFTFHIAKLVLHRLSMQRYAEQLIKNGYKLQYISITDDKSNTAKLFQYLTGKYMDIHVVQPDDDWLWKEIKKGIQTTACNLHEHANPNFITSIAEGYAFFDTKKRYFQTDFYAFQRKRLNILWGDDDKPMGGKLTFDADNRKSYPKNHQFKEPKLSPLSKDFADAVTYIQKHIPNCIGTVDHFKEQGFFYPTTTEEAESCFEEFLTQRFKGFGDYEDSFGKNPDEHFLNHSVLTPALNIGLINPSYVIQRALEFGKSHQIPMNDLEGFIRQIIGWREFLRIIYQREGRKQRGSNFWNFKRDIPKSFYTGETGIEPVDVVIKKTLKTGYAHHIERLMVLGNFFMLCEFNPHSVYQWFMEMYIDAYDWVMVPNVYGMSQFADGGLITSKPYFSGSNYIRKMSDYPKEKGGWQAIWDGLFWRFVQEHRQYLQHNPRLGMMVMTFDKMNPDKQSEHLNYAEGFLSKL